MLTRERLYIDECLTHRVSPISTRSSTSWSSPEQRKRLAAIHQEFPDLKNSTIEEALEKLSVSIAEGIYDEASMVSEKKNNGICLENFRKWAQQGTPDVEFLASLFEGLQPVDAFTRTDEYRRDLDNVPFLDGFTMLG